MPVPTPPVAPGPPDPSPTAMVASHPSHRGPALLGLILFALLFSTARSVDVPRTAHGIKSDEATYVAMALSLAYDGDLTYRRSDLERFAGLYHSGPEGIFLKRGKSLRIALQPSFPFVRLVKTPDGARDRLYFGKAFIYPLIAAPFLRLYGLNGLLVLNVLLLALIGVCGYFFLAAQSTPLAAASLTTAFLGAAALPVYAVFLMPEIFNVALVFVAYFLWLYKEVLARTPAGVARVAWWLHGWTDIAAAVLLGAAVYSKPLPIALLVAPPVLLAWSRRQWWRGLAIGTTAVALAATLFTITALVSGEFNYQGGDRSSFYGRYPFDRPDSTFEGLRRELVITDGSAVTDVLTSRELPIRFLRNIEYFLIGRHFGFVPYYFPAVVAIVVWLLSPARRDVWRLLIVGTFVAAAAGLLLIMPFTWSGGGGPPGNRYVLSAYPMLFFILPSTSALPGAIAWIGGSLFTAKILLDPFSAAAYTWQISEKGLARRLPVELPMAQDLPVMLAQPLRGRIVYGSDPFLLLYFLDQNAFPPEPEGMWVSGSGRADIIVRSERPIDHLVAEAQSPIRTRLTVSLGKRTVSMTLEPGKVARFDVPASGFKGRAGYVYLMTTHSSDGFIPHVTSGNGDYRNLGAQLRFRAVNAPPGQ